MLKLVWFFPCALLVCGCHSGGNNPGEKPNYVYVDADASKAAQSGNGFEDPSKVATGNVTLAQVQSLEAQQAKLADQLKGHPSDANVKKQFIELTNNLAQAEMGCDAISPKEKYRNALKYYRQVLKVDPKDPDANKWAGEIIDVYKSMGKPVPN